MTIDSRVDRRQQLELDQLDPTLEYLFIKELEFTFF
jgi:hypothetical protein